DEIRHKKAGFADRQPRFANMVLGLAIEASAVGPADPRVPEPGNCPSNGSLRAHILEEPDGTARSDDAREFPQGDDLLLVWKDAEEKARNGGIKRAIGEMEVNHVHLLKLD